MIAALIGAGGLGGDVLRGLQTLEVGAAAEVGVGIVCMAILLDRFVSGLADPTSRHDPTPVKYATFVAIPAALIGGVLGWTTFPSQLMWSFASGIDRAVDWALVNVVVIGDTGLGTGPFSDFLTIRFITPLRELFVEDIPWPVMIALVAIIGLSLRGWRLAVGLGAALISIGLLGMWELSMDTLAQCIVAVAMTLTIGVPVGVLTSRSDRFRSVLRPFLDFLQTIPSFVLLVPMMMLFNAGRVPGIMASVLYALPVAIHYTDLGLRGVAAGDERGCDVVRHDQPTAIDQGRDPARRTPDHDRGEPDDHARVGHGGHRRTRRRRRARIRNGEGAAADRQRRHWVSKPASRSCCWPPSSTG